MHFGSRLSPRPGHLLAHFGCTGSSLQRPYTFSAWVTLPFLIYEGQRPMDLGALFSYFASFCSRSYFLFLHILCYSSHSCHPWREKGVNRIIGWIRVSLMSSPVDCVKVWLVLTTLHHCLEKSLFWSLNVSRKLLPQNLCTCCSSEWNVIFQISAQLVPSPPSGMTFQWELLYQSRWVRLCYISKAQIAGGIKQQRIISHYFWLCVT